jgi:Cu2+-exporting ATPase
MTEDEVLALAAARRPRASTRWPARSWRLRGIASWLWRGVGVPASAAVGVRRGGRREVAVGGPALLRERGLEPLAETTQWSDDGATVLHVFAGGEVVGAVALADEIRPESREAVDALHDRGVRVVMITGDAQPVARAVAAELGIDQVFAGAAGEQEREGRGAAGGRVHGCDGGRRRERRAGPRAGRRGIAIGAGTDVAIASAGVILASDDPRAVLSLIELSRAGYRKMKQNLWWAAGYNLAAGCPPPGCSRRLASCCDGGGCGAHVPVHDRGGGECAAAAPAGPAAGECGGPARMMARGSAVR